MSQSEASRGVPAGAEPLVHWLEVLFDPHRLRNAGVKLLRAIDMPDLAVEAGPIGEGERPVSRLTIITGGLALGSYGMKVHFSNESGSVGVDRPCTGCDTLEIDPEVGIMSMHDPFGNERVYPLDPADDTGRGDRDWAAGIVRSMAIGNVSRDPSSSSYGQTALAILREFEVPHDIDPSVLARVMAARVNR